MLLLPLIFGITTQAQAFPNVGDRAVFEVRAEVDGQVVFEGVTSRKLAEYDIEKHAFRIENVNDGAIGIGTYTVAPRSETWVGADDLAQEADLADLVRSCGTVNAPGKRVEARIGQKHVQACAQVMRGGGETQIAQVPFGYVFFDYEIEQKAHRVRIRQRMLEFENGPEPEAGQR